jgi:hypothetical protein
MVYVICGTGIIGPKRARSYEGSNYGRILGIYVAGPTEGRERGNG